MHICFVFRRRVPDTGSTAVSEYARHLAANGDDVSFIGGTDGESVEKDTWNGVDVWRIPTDLSTALSISPVRFAYRSAKLLRRYPELRDVDVVYMHGFPGLGPALRLPGVDIPTIADIRGTAVSNQLLERVSHLGIRLQRHVVDRTTVLDDRVATRIFGRDHGLDVVPLGADFDIFSPSGQTQRPTGVPSDSPLIGYVGRLHPSRDLDRLVASFAEFVCADLDAHLAIIGDGEARRELKATSKRLGVTDRVHLPGPVAHHQIPDYLRGFDVVAGYVADKPQYRYQPPIKTIEALATARPTVLTSTPGNQQFYTGDNALVAPDTPSEYGSALETLIESPATREELRSNARESVKRFDYENIVKNDLRPVLRKTAKSG
ncbi:glycosyltransferase family 4 protein [Halostella sp. PRR32]|uniref:glycosyltransferase family 4 protein n=1 Tax=Halostella sp. PRR32 TaxID=3098147 RepID=UPI002B1CEC15|nr:glycosyltransferase family 4 protein [Halostella sp. PRR32]